MPDDAPSRKAVNDWINRPFAAYSAHVEKQRRLFAAFNDFVSEHGAWVVSPPGDKRIRIECPANSGLPIRLCELGYKLSFVGAGATRNTPNGIIPVDIIETKLPVR
jgi:hypothetical protein